MSDPGHGATPRHGGGGTAGRGQIPVDPPTQIRSLRVPPEQRAVRPDRPVARDQRAAYPDRPAGRLNGHQVSAAREVLPGTDLGGPPGRSRHGRRRRATAPAGRRSVGSRLLRDVREVVGTVLVALVVAVLVKTFLVQPFYIPSESMEETLLVGDRVLVSKLEPGPLALERGDVVVFVDPGGWLQADPPEPGLGTRVLTFVGLLPANSGEHLIKRVIGLPGDVVSCCDAEGRLTVNGVPVDEPYLFPGDDPSAVEFEITVPEGRLWVMGDHRSVSSDSRFHLGDPGGGSIPLDSVVGRSVLVMWPLSRWETLSTPEEVYDGVGGRDGVS